MSNHQDKAMKDLVMLGSHDAGCVGKPKVAMPISLTLVPFVQQAPAAWAVTQTKSISQQLCDGYRVFDLRLKDFNPTDIPSYNTQEYRPDAEIGDNWRIHHGGFYFQTLREVALEIRGFCTQLDTELIVLRTKIEGTKDKKTIVNVIKTLHDLINGKSPSSIKCVVKRSVYTTGAQNSDYEFTATSIRALKTESSYGDGVVMGSPVVIMPYIKVDSKTLKTIPVEKLNFAGISKNGRKIKKLKKKNEKIQSKQTLQEQLKNDVFNDETVEDFIFDYKTNQFGGASESLFGKKMFVRQDESHKKWVELKVDKPNLTFGFWMTITAARELGTNKGRDRKRDTRILSLDVYKNSKILLDCMYTDRTGPHTHALTAASFGAPNVQCQAYSGWIRQTNKHYGSMKGWTIWTDFAGDEMLHDTVTEIIKMNNNEGRNPVEAGETEGEWSLKKLLNRE